MRCSRTVLWGGVGIDLQLLRRRIRESHTLPPTGFVVVIGTSLVVVLLGVSVVRIANAIGNLRKERKLLTRLYRACHCI